MATLLEQIANIQTLIDNLEALAFGDENTSATHGGQTRDSLAKAIKGRFDALQAMVQGRLAYETKAAMDTAGAPPAGELAEVWNDTSLENNGLYGWDGSAWVSSGYDVKSILSGDINETRQLINDVDDERSLSEILKRVPLNNDPVDYVWGVKSGNQLLGYFDGAGKWHSDHNHDGLPSPTVLTEAADVVWGVTAGNQLLGYFDGAGKWHSDHDHEEFLQLQSQINNQQSQIDNMSVTGASASDLLLRLDESTGYSQIVAFNGTDQRQITSAGSDWVAPVVHHNNIVRCFSDYTTGSLEPHSILPSGEIIPEQSVLLQQFVTGQSLSLGSRGYIIDPYGPYNFDDNPVGVGRLFTPSCPAEYQEHCLTLDNGARSDGSALIPTAEVADGVLGETVCSSYMIAVHDEAYRKGVGLKARLAAAISGNGGVPYDNLKKGTTVYANALNRISAIKTAANSNGWAHVVTHIRIIHGESQYLAADPIDFTESGYADVIREWVTDYQTDISLITNQSNAMPGVLCQMNTANGDTLDIPHAQLKAHFDNPDIFLIGPKYQFPYHDTAHMLAEGYVKLGEKEGQAMMHWFAGRKWEPLHAVSVSLTGTTVTIETNVSEISDVVAGPVGELIIDTATVADPGNYGFLVTDESVSIQSVSINGGNQLLIELSGTPSQGTRIEYATMTDLANSPAGPRGRGCIRDTDNRLISRFDGTEVHNWLCAFRHTF